MQRVPTAMLVLAVAAGAVQACASPSEPSGARPSASADAPSSTSDGQASREPAPPSSRPTVPASFPPSSLDPRQSAAELFDEPATAADIEVVELGSETRDGAVVRDVAFAGSRGNAVRAWIVGPSAGPPRAGVLFLHWLGEHDSNRNEFLEEAADLARHGVASILIDQVFPFAERASGADHDRVEIGRQVRDARRAWRILETVVGDAPLAVVGHDFGGMYAAIVRALEPEVAATVVMTATGSWADWFIQYGRVVPAAEEPAYRAALEDLDPIAWIGRAPGQPLLLQFAAADAFVPPARAEALAAAAGATAETRFEAGTRHPLDDASRVVRDAWILEQLGLE